MKRLMLMVLMLGLVAGCESTLVTTHGLPDGDITEEDGADDEGEGETADTIEGADQDVVTEDEQVDNDTVDTTEDETVDGDGAESEGEQVEDETEETPEPCPHAETTATCEAIQGTCPEGQACLTMGGHFWCYEWLEWMPGYPNWDAPLDNPPVKDEQGNKLDPPDESWYQSDGTAGASADGHYFHPCTNDNWKCKPRNLDRYDDPCCDMMAGFWMGEGSDCAFRDDAGNRVPGTCNADHQCIRNPQE